MSHVQVFYLMLSFGRMTGSETGAFFNGFGLAALTRETRWLIVILTAHSILWVTAPLIGFASPPLDVVENLFWGREWLLGTYKHPPLQAWLTEIAWQIGGLAAVYLLPQLCVMATAIALFLFGRDIDNRQTGFCAALIYLLSFYATIASPEFNANILSTPFWAFSSYCLWLILAAKGRPASTLPWYGLCLSIALAFYSKYSVIFLLCGLSYATLLSPFGRQMFLHSRLYLAIAATLLLCLPNLIWLVQHDFQPFYYAAARAENLTGIDRLINPFKFFVGVTLAFAIPLLLLALSGARIRETGIGKPDRLFVYIMAFGPLLTMMFVALAGGTGIKSMWGSSAAVWLPLVLSLHLTKPAKWRFFNAGRIMAILLFFVLPAAVLGYSKYSEATPYPQRTAWPGAALAKASLSGWQKHSPDLPEIIIGSTWEAGLIAHFLPNRPMVLEDGDFQKSPWVVPAAVQEKGALVVWTGANSPIAAFAPFDAHGAVPLLHKGRETEFHWAVLKPVRD